MCKWLLLALMLSFISLTGSIVFAASADDIAEAIRSLAEPEFDENSVVRFDSLTLDNHDLQVILTSGEFCFFKPLIFDDDTLFYGGFFEGSGCFQFEPPVRMEKDQLQRFFKTDSLNRQFDEMLLLFDTQTYRKIINNSQPLEQPVELKKFSKYKNHLEELTKDESLYYLFKTVKNLLYPLNKPFLVVSTILEGGEMVHYLFDQYEPEEVKFSRRYWAPGQVFMELVNSYSIYTDETYNMINGIDKNAIDVKKYKVEAVIDRGGKFSAVTDMTFNILLTNTRMLDMVLHEELGIDSILDESSQKVPFLRYTKDKNMSYPFYLVLNRSYHSGETVTLRFFYGGDIIERELEGFYVDASAYWYPRYGNRQRAAFDMNFKTHKDFEFTSTGRLRESSIVDDTLMTHWTVDEPVVNVSFNIGLFKKYNFKEDDVVPVEVYFSKSLHEDFARSAGWTMMRIGRHMEKQVAEDVINCLRLFSHYYGAYPNDKLVVTEVLYRYGESFPGFLHLGFDTWVNTDLWGEERIFRAHETAHQWWGSKVSYATYHDKWLCEGFAEYSAMMYYQALAGSEKFLDKMSEMRKEIFSNRKYIFGSGEEAGPIALGYRTSSTKTEGDFGLIIYEKGAFVLHMLRNMLLDLQLMNEDRFFDMMKEFYQKYKGGDPSTNDFKKITEKYTGIDMTWFFDQWVYGTELPTYDFKYQLSQNDTGQWLLHCHVVTLDVSENFKMYVPLEIEFENGKKVYMRLIIDALDLEFNLPPLDLKPQKIVLNPFESVLANVKQ